MERAWEQFDEIGETNRFVKIAQLSSNVGMALFSKHLKASLDSLSVPTASNQQVRGLRLASMTRSAKVIAAETGSRAGALSRFARRDQDVSSARRFDEPPADASARSSPEQAEALAGGSAAQRRPGDDCHNADFRRGSVDENGNPESESDHHSHLHSGDGRRQDQWRITGAQRIFPAARDFCRHSTESRPNHQRTPAA